MTGGFGSFSPWQTPEGGFNWNTLANVGAGMLANSQYGIPQALGKGYQQAMGDSLEQAKAGALFQEQENKRRTQRSQQRMLDSINSQLSSAQQAAPAAGGMLQAPQSGASPLLGVGPSNTGENPAAAAAGNRLAAGGGAPPAPPMPQGGGAMPGGSVNIMGMQVGPQQIGAFKMWAGAGNFEKAIEALTGGDPNMTDVLKNYYVAKQQGYPGTLLDYQKELRTPGTNVTVNNNSAALESKLSQSFGDEVGKMLATNVQQAAKAGETKGLVQIWQRLQQISGNSGQFDLLRTKLGPWAQMVGAEIDTTKMGYGQAMEAITSKMAPGMRIPGSGNTSDRDIMLFLNGMMKLGNTPEANALITSTLNAVADAQVEAGQISADIALNPAMLKEGLAKLRALDPFKGFKENAAKLGVNVEDFSDGVKGGGSTTPGPAAPKPKLKIDPKTMKVVPFEEEQGWLNPPGNNMGYSSGVRG